MINFGDFEKVDIRVGRVIEVEDFPKARKPSYKLKIDFGEKIGVKKSSAQLVSNYTKEDLRNRLVLAVVNFPSRQIGPVMSEVLVVGIPDKNGECILIKPDNDVPLGGKLY
ncbi:MAG: tRNA-binding protein [Asgard group archaeon]|nr:tRNA-binding protein [Asgard group archaeon]